MCLHNSQDVWQLVFMIAIPSTHSPVVTLLPEGELSAALAFDYVPGWLFVVASRGSHTMRVKGTEGYIAPEVLQGEAATSAADMWAVGVMLHKTMFMSDPVFEGGSGASSGSDWGTPLIPKHENESLRQLLQVLSAPRMFFRVVGFLS